MTTANAPPIKSRHDMIYTVLLAVLAFFYLITSLQLWFLRDRIQPEARTGIYMVLAMFICYLLAMLAILIIRIAAPSIRKWPTFTLNILLAPLFPAGTALAIYGFWKVDKQLPSTVDARS
jgi:hypothetical protein